MKSNPAFELFEEICGELSNQDETVLTDDDFTPAMLERVKRWAGEAGAHSAITKALDYLSSHFHARGSTLPFKYDLNSGRVSVLNREYLDFVSNSTDQRSSPKKAKNFELATSKYLSTRLTGTMHRVGSPRKKHKKLREFAAYLVKEFKFRDGVLVGRDKDGGLDILWFPPLGAFPFRAMVSIQCKNTPYDKEEGLESVGRAAQTLRRHSHAGAEGNHLHCVVYNDYIDEKLMDHARDVGFVPLGLSDLAPLNAPPCALKQL